MLQNIKPQDAIKKSGLYYQTGKAKYRAVCKRFYRRRKAQAKRELVEQEKTMVIKDRRQLARIKVQLERHLKKNQQEGVLRRTVNEAAEQVRVLEQSNHRLEKQAQRWRTR